MLTPDERNLVEIELGDLLAEYSDVKVFIAVAFPNREKPLLRELPLGLNRPGDYSAYILDHCLRSRWESDPSMMELLLARLVGRGKVNLSPLLDRVRLHVDPNPDVYAARWVLGRQPFFARSDLRKHVQQLIAKNERPVLRVNGPEGSGRSYTAKFLEYLMDQAGEHLHVIYAEVPEGMGPSYEVEELAGSLAAPMGLDGIPARSTSSYAGALSRWILSHAMKQPGKWIFVIERAAQPFLKPEVTQFIHLFAKAACTGEYRKKIRLVLVDYVQTIPGILPADTMEEAIPPAEASASRTEIINCLLAHNAVMQSNGGVAIEEKGLPTIAENILGTAPPTGKQRLQHVYDELMAIASAGK